MSFTAKTDFCGLVAATDGKLTLKTDTDNSTASEATGPDEHGDIAVSDVYGHITDPSNEYELNGDLILKVILGKVNTIPTASHLGGKKFMLANVSVKTAAGSPVSVTATANGLEATDVETTTIDFGTIAVTAIHKAQQVKDSLTVTGGALNSNDITIGCTPTYALVEGKRVTHDVHAGYIEQSITVLQTGLATPAVTPGTGWQIMANPSRSNPDADYPKFAFTLKKYFAATVPASYGPVTPPTP